MYIRVFHKCRRLNSRSILLGGLQFLGVLSNPFGAKLFEVIPLRQFDVASLIASLTTPSSREPQPTTSLVRSFPNYKIQNSVVIFGLRETRWPNQTHVLIAMEQSYAGKPQRALRCLVAWNVRKLLVMKIPVSLGLFSAQNVRGEAS